DRLVGLFDDPDSSLTELPVVLLPLLWHLDPHCRCLYGPGGTSGLATCRILSPGTYLWTLPSGLYLVDPTGTYDLTPRPGATQPTEPPTNPAGPADPPDE
ncbi:hypothetical protein, partial [Nocardioides immobilis]|uniref:hypothetical protein n=1 Tax=Nocardioides immobilis TaxID=2049295 RepID=UPI0015FD02DD